MLDLLMNRRTIRKYQDKEIDKETIDKIIKGALTSPSGVNKKPWELIVVTDKEILSSLGKARGNISNHIKDASLGIVVAADPAFTEIWIEDASIMATVIQLVSQSLGLGSCWIQVRGRVDATHGKSEDYVKKVLNIPDKYHVECMLAIGYPNEEKKPHSKDTLAYDKVHYNKF